MIPFFGLEFGGDFLFILRIKKINHDQFVVIPCVCVRFTRHDSSWLSVFHEVIMMVCVCVMLVMAVSCEVCHEVIMVVKSVSMK